MTSERLADIRERHSVGLGLERPGDVAALLAHVDHLTAENARLREGIESVRVNALCAEEFLPRGSLALRETARKCAALLNPPTEGETDHE